MVSVVSEKRQAHFLRFILKKQLSLVIALATANMALANDAFDQFLADTTVNVKARSALIKLDANDVAYDASGYDAATATAVLFGTGANAALGSTGTGLDALAGADPATVQAALAAPATLAV
jgi:energy-converting hydrogenase Eha subunit H